MFLIRKPLETSFLVGILSSVLKAFANLFIYIRVTPEFQVLT